MHTWTWIAGESLTEQLISDKIELPKWDYGNQIMEHPVCEERSLTFC